jgi:glyoxylate reductase
MAGSTSSKPGVLMLGIVHHAKAEFEKLSEVADVVVGFCCHGQDTFGDMSFANIPGTSQQVTEGTRDEFIRDLDNGKYDNIVAISRTYDSVKARLLISKE